MLGALNHSTPDVSPGASRAYSSSPQALLQDASEATYGRLAPTPVGTPDLDQGWIAASDILRSPRRLEPLIVAASQRFGCQDRKLVLAQIARETIAQITTAAVHTWSHQRRLLDFSAANVMLREGDLAISAGLRSLRTAVLASDPMATGGPATHGSRAGGAGIQVLDEGQMLERLLHMTVGNPVPRGAMPEGEPEHVATVATVIAGVRSLVASGDRHLWGSAALAVTAALAQASHSRGHEAAAADLGTVFSARPDLAATVAVIATQDDLGEPLQFAIRRTCCVLYKLREDGMQCATCSLRDREESVASLTDWYRSERRRIRRR